MIQKIYSAVSYPLTPLLYAWLKRRATRGKENAARMAERFGHSSTPRPAGKLIWLHAASVGEAQSVLTLVRALLKAEEQLHLLITTGTVTSATLVAQQKLPRTIHQFVPIDTYAAVKRFLNHWRPDLALWVESELWPQLLWQAQARSIPMLLINARMSAKSFSSWQRWPRTITSLLAGFTAIYAGSPEDAERLRLLGASQVRDIGNLKFDAANLPEDAALLSLMQQTLKGRTVWLAASTHANEEQLIASAHKQLKETFPQLLTIIVPRHAARGDAIAAELRTNGMHVAQRSKGEPILRNTSIYLADTMGELGSFYRLCPVVFLGGSLIAHGGHNPLEPARLDCAIITGPHTHNFNTIMQRMVLAQAIRVLPGKDQLTQTVQELLQSPSAQQALITNAARLVHEASGASTEIVQHSLQLLGRP